MKHRVLVMNGTRVVQAEGPTGDWANQKVDKAGDLKPGIYNIYTAKEADTSQWHEGFVVHADSTAIYQQVGRSYVAHNREKFDKVPVLGSMASISYDKAGRAQVEAQAVKLGRARSR
jgi:hypothetical protein